MKVYRYPAKEEWEQLVKRPVPDNPSIEKNVREILAEVKSYGDAALKKYTLQFDKIELENFIVTSKEIDEGAKQISKELIEAMKSAINNIRLFHEKQIPVIEKIETVPGVFCWRKNVPIEKIGLYIPGGTAPLFSTVLMLAVPASIAGCSEVTICTPPGKDGKVNPVILAAAHLSGIKKIVKLGGVQAIAAMAYGTASVPKVYKIFGPGNHFVTLAKQLVQQEEGIAIDMPAGPSEVAIFADETALPSFVAADLLSQAEHGVDSQVILVTTYEPLVGPVMEEIQKQLVSLPRREFAAKTLSLSRIIVVKDKNEGIALLNDYAPEHLILACSTPEEMAENITNAGSVFLGHFSPESVGDYASGTNHILPTNGYAKSYSGVSLDSFVKKITFQQLSAAGLQNIGPIVEVMADAEGLDAHKNAVTIRLSELNRMEPATQGKLKNI